MEEPTQVIFVLKAIQADDATFERGRMYRVGGALAKEFVEQGLAQIINMDEDESPPKDAPTWEEPELGVFHFDGIGWIKKVEAPAFDAYQYRRTDLKTGSNERYILSIDANHEKELPSPDAVAVAKKVLAEQAALASKVADALWADFTGAGPHSGMYWHGDLDSLAEGLETGMPPASVRDLFALMSLSSIHIRKLSGRSEKPMAELNFEAAFEEEHGVGVLTDGQSIVGIGYSHDASPFD
jgi:uncharacterized protein DUF6985